MARRLPSRRREQGEEVTVETTVPQTQAGLN